MRRSRTGKEQRASQASLPVKEKGVSDSGQEREDPALNSPVQATADNLVRIATKALMQMHDVDFETAQRWIAGAAVPEVKNGEPDPKSRKTRS